MLREFLHPQYSDHQYIYFNNDATMMFEQLSQRRAYVYKWNEFENKFSLVKRIAFMENYNLPSVIRAEISPNFKKFIDYDHSYEKFVVKDFITSETISIIPTSVMKKES